MFKTRKTCSNECIIWNLYFVLWRILKPHFPLPAALYILLVAYLSCWSKFERQNKLYIDELLTNLHKLLVSNLFGIYLSGKYLWYCFSERCVTDVWERSGNTSEIKKTVFLYHALHTIFYNNFVFGTPLPHSPLFTGCKLNTKKTLRRCSRRRLYVLYILHLRFISCENEWKRVVETD